MSNNFSNKVWVNQLCGLGFTFNESIWILRVFRNDELTSAVNIGRQSNIFKIHFYLKKWCVIWRTDYLKSSKSILSLLSTYRFMKRFWGNIYIVFKYLNVGERQKWICLCYLHLKRWHINDFDIHDSNLCRTQFILIKIYFVNAFIKFD